MESDIALPEQIKIHPKLCSAANLCHKAQEKYQNEDFVSVAYHRPNYYKSPYVTIPKQKV